MFSKEQILSFSNCEELFIPELNKTKELYLCLAKIYHPDVCKDSDADVVFKHISELYIEATKKIEKGIWTEKDVLLLESTDGKKYKLKYLKYFEFELGFCYIGRRHIIYVLSEKNEKYFQNALKVLENFIFTNSDMEKEFKRVLPQKETHFRTLNGEFCLVLKKDKDVFSLEDILSSNVLLDARHIAWIISRLLNLCCFLKYNNLVHNGINLKNCFISPSQHLLYLESGWWYTTHVDEKMLGTSKDVYNTMSIKTKSDKISSYTTDIECIRSVGRRLSKDLDVPKPLDIWLNKGTSKDVMDEFKDWDIVLKESWGTRKFILWKLSEKEVYI